ncbi:hypothetical protein B0H13DRAFT_1879605 [Mycena leptocephala]|nr:hypothetical protein B0H13DRAFT_1879605 [Mycena leptocephala]
MSATGRCRDRKFQGSPAREGARVSSRISTLLRSQDQVRTIVQASWSRDRGSGSAHCIGKSNSKFWMQTNAKDQWRIHAGLATAEGLFICSSFMSLAWVPKGIAVPATMARILAAFRRHQFSMTIVQASWSRDRSSGSTHYIGKPNSKFRCKPSLGISQRIRAPKTFSGSVGKITPCNQTEIHTNTAETQSSGITGIGTIYLISTTGLSIDSASYHSEMIVALASCIHLRHGFQMSTAYAFSFDKPCPSTHFRHSKIPIFDSYLELCSTSRLREGAQRHELQYLVPKMDAVEAASGVKLIG